MTELTQEFKNMHQVEFTNHPRHKDASPMDESTKEQLKKKIDVVRSSIIHFNQIFLDMKGQPLRVETFNENLDKYLNECPTATDLQFGLGMILDEVADMLDIRETMIKHKDILIALKEYNKTA